MGCLQKTLREEWIECIIQFWEVSALAYKGLWREACSSPLPAEKIEWASFPIAVLGQRSNAGIRPARRQSTLSLTI